MSRVGRIESSLLDLIPCLSIRQTRSELALRATKDLYPGEFRDGSLDHLDWLGTWIRIPLPPLDARNGSGMCTHDTSYR